MSRRSVGHVVRLLGTCALVLLSVSRLPAQTAPALPTWTFEVLRPYPGNYNSCETSVATTGLAISAGGVTAAGWSENGCGYHQDAADAGLVVQRRTGQGPWTEIRQNDARCGRPGCYFRGGETLALSPD